MELGKFKLKFDEKGELESVLIENAPLSTLTLNAFTKPIDLKTCEDENEMLDKSRIVLSHWFALVNAVELLDQSRFNIRNVPYSIDRFADGRIKEIGIRFYTEEIAQHN